MQTPPMIGKNIQRIRTARRLTLNVLSERSGVSKAMLSQIEGDKVNPTVATVWKIAKGLNVELNDLLEGVDEPTRVFSLNPASDDGSKLEKRKDRITIKILSPLSSVEDLEMYLLTFEPNSTLASEPHVAGSQDIDGRQRLGRCPGRRELRLPQTGRLPDVPRRHQHSISNQSGRKRWFTWW